MREFVVMTFVLLTLAAAGAETGHAGNKNNCAGGNIAAVSPEC